MPIARGICAQKNSADRTHERQRDEIDDEGGEAYDNRCALSALQAASRSALP